MPCRYSSPSFLAMMVFALMPGALMAEDFPQFATHDPASEITVDHSAFGALLDAYTQQSDNGVVLVDYAAVSKADAKALGAYIGALAGTDPRRLDQDEAFAYWVNLYNAVTLKVILDNYPVASIREIKPGLLSFGPWKKDRVTVSGARLSLDNIEHDILRVHWDEPRIHYAVNCASIGCPNLSPTPWTGADLEARLDGAARDFINHPRGVSVEDGRITASSLFDWYRDDFGADDGAIIDHWRAYAEPALEEALEGKNEIDRYEYDWSLNEADTGDANEGTATSGANTN